MVGLTEMEESLGIPILIAEALRDEVIKELPPCIHVTVASSAGRRAAVHFARAGVGSRAGENTASFYVEVGDEEYRFMTNPLDGEDPSFVVYDEGFLSESKDRILRLAKRLRMME